jgi:hypothetical protein
MPLHTDTDVWRDMNRSSTLGTSVGPSTDALQGRMAGPSEAYPSGASP